MKKHGPWKIVSSEEKYKNPWLRVREDKVIHPNGEPGIFGIADTLVAVGILPIDDRNQVYFVEQFRYAVSKKTIEIPFGVIDKGETPLQTAKRELKEETGIIAKEWINLGRFEKTTTIINSPGHIFLTRDLTFTPSSPDGTEIIKVIKMPLKKAVKMVIENKFDVALSCLAILLAEKYLKRNS